MIDFLTSTSAIMASLVCAAQRPDDVRNLALAATETHVQSETKDVAKYRKGSVDAKRDEENEPQSRARDRGSNRKAARQDLERDIEKMVNAAVSRIGDRKKQAWSGGEEEDLELRRVRIFYDRDKKNIKAEGFVLVDRRNVRHSLWKLYYRDKTQGERGMESKGLFNIGRKVMKWTYWDEAGKKTIEDHGNARSSGPPVAKEAERPTKRREDRGDDRSISDPSAKKSTRPSRGGPGSLLHMQPDRGRDSAAPKTAPDREGEIGRRHQ